MEPNPDLDHKQFIDFDRMTLESLSVGDAIECGGLLSGLSDAPLRFDVIDVKRSPDIEVLFYVSYMGIRVRMLRCRALGSKVSWSTHYGI